MWGERRRAAIVPWIALAFSLSACSVLEAFEPPPLKAEFPPQPPVPSMPPQPGVAQRSAPPGAGATQAEMASWLSSTGYRDYQVAALVQLADVESGFRPCATGPGGYRYLLQWGGGRLRQLREFAQTSDCPHLRTQLAFADKELRNDPKFSCFWDASTTPAAYIALRRIFGRGSC
jgi:tail lysozyme